MQRELRKNSLLYIEVLLIGIVLFTLTKGKGIEYDESYTFWMVTKHSFREIIGATAADVHPPLYYFLCKAAVLLFGEKLQVLALVSVVATLGTLILNNLYGTRPFGVWAIAILNSAFALSPFLLNYNIESRMYPLMNFFVMGVVWASFHLIHKNSAGGWIGLALFGIGGVYTQYFAVLPIVICYVWLGIMFLRQKNYKQVRMLFLCSGASILAYIPWLSILIRTFERKETTEQNRYDFTLIDFLKEAFHSNLLYSVAMAGILLIMAFLALCLFYKRFTEEERSFFIMLGISTVFCFFVSLWIGKQNGHFYSFRYVLYINLFCWLFLVLVCSRINGIVMAALSIWILVLCGSGYVLTKDYRYNFTPYMAKTETFIAEHIAPEDILSMDLEAWDILYGYYVPGHEWVDYYQLDPDQYRGQTIWIFHAVTPFYTEEECQQMKMETERYYGFGFMGAQRFELERVYVKP